VADSGLTRIRDLAGVLVHSEKDSLEAIATLPAFFALGQDLEEARSSRGGWLVGART
jgi:hypothetical protein